MTATKPSLWIRWLTLAVSCFLTFLPLYGLYLVHADTALIVGFGLAFSLCVSTASIAILWWRGREQLTYVELALTSSLVVLAFAAWLLSSGGLEDLLNISILLLLLIFSVAGIAAKWLYEVFLAQTGKFLRS
jgi:hypothetical protein